MPFKSEIVFQGLNEPKHNPVKVPKLNLFNKPSEEKTNKQPKESNQPKINLDINKVTQSNKDDQGFNENLFYYSERK
jgi:hypothetical protein